MSRRNLFTLLFSLLAALFSLAQDTTQTQPVGDKPSEPFFICNPGDASTMRNCYFACSNRNRPSDAPCLVPPKATYVPDPQYSDHARKKRIQGTVLAQITVSAEGVVSDARISRSLEPSLDKQTLETVRKWRFQPATLDGKPVAATISVETTFRLR